MLVTHAWPNFSRRNTNARTLAGPASRNAYVLAFETPPVDPQGAVPLPDYSGISELISWYFSVLFGKRFDNHGLLESVGFFNLPNLDSYGTLCVEVLPQNSHSSRVDYPVPLNLTELKRIKRLLTKPSSDPITTRILQTASKFYAQALQAFEHDSEVAYLHLITSLELLTSISALDPQNFYEPATKEYLHRIAAEMIDGEKVAKHFRTKLLSIKRRVVETTLQLVDDGFFVRSESQVEFARLTKASFRKCIGAAYDLRSKYVHTGAPFGKWIENSIGGQNAEVQVGAPVVSDKDYGRILANAPTFVGLERVVRYCILRQFEFLGLYSDRQEDA